LSYIGLTSKDLDHCLTYRITQLLLFDPSSYYNTALPYIVPSYILNITKLYLSTDSLTLHKSLSKGLGIDFRVSITVSFPYSLPQVSDFPQCMPHTGLRKLLYSYILLYVPYCPDMANTRMVRLQALQLDLIDLCGLY